MSHVTSVSYYMPFQYDLLYEKIKKLITFKLIKKMRLRDLIGQFANTISFQSLWLCLKKLENPSCILKVPAINSFPESHPDAGRSCDCSI